MSDSDWYVGQRVRLFREDCGLPVGTEGLIVRNHGGRVVVRWDGTAHDVEFGTNKNQLFQASGFLQKIPARPNDWEAFLELE